MIQILIADDHSVVRKGIKQILQHEFSTAEIHEAIDAESLINLIVKNKYDLVVSDINMPGRSGLDALKQIKHTHPKLPVLILSIHPPEQYALRALKLGASSFLSKNAPADELIKAVKSLLAGKKYFSQSVMEVLTDNIDSDFRRQSHESLSSREFEVMKWLAAGKSVSHIAESLALSVTTISTYRHRVMEKIGLSSNSELTKYAMENQLLEF